MIPIALVSKLLSKQEQRWATIKKDCYAIVYAFKKFECLIRDRPFVLRTVHKNLLYIDKELNAKVKRWKLMIQEYDFKWEYIKGEDNVVADQASRLIERDGEEDPELVRPCNKLLVKKTTSKALAQVQELDEEDLCMLSEFDHPPGVYDLIAKVHEAEVGHGGVDRTMIKLRKLVKALNRKPWKYMREHVRRFIRECPCCPKDELLEDTNACLSFHRCFI